MQILTGLNIDFMNLLKLLGKSKKIFFKTSDNITERRGAELYLFSASLRLCVQYIILLAKFTYALFDSP